MIIHVLKFIMVVSNMFMRAVVATRYYQSIPLSCSAKCKFKLLGTTEAWIVCPAWVRKVSMLNPLCLKVPSATLPLALFGESFSRSLTSQKCRVLSRFTACVSNFGVHAREVLEQLISIIMSRVPVCICALSWVNILSDPVINTAIAWG